MRRNPGRSHDAGVRLVGHLRGRPGSAAAFSVADRESSMSPNQEERDRSSGIEESANLAALMDRAESVKERSRDDAAEAAGCFVDWQAWWTDDW